VKARGEKTDVSLIGQFGVGFYSAYLVADRVEVTSRGAGSTEAWRWVSEARDAFTLEPAERDARGTSIVLHLREDQKDYLDAWRLRELVRKYSDFVGYPIELQKEAEEPKEGEEPASPEFETANQASALWTRSKSEVSEDEYKDFYKHLTSDFEAPLAWTHNRVEGRSEYTQLLYVPSKAPFDLWDRQHRRGIRLYVRRVFIMDDAEQLMPVYLRFVKGVVDSADLPLNVSREILQESRDVRAIREGCTKRVLSMLEDLAENRAEDYARFWTEFGQVLKEGMGEDFSNQERLSKLLRFASTSTATGEQTVSLAQYVARMKPGQDRIYYVTAENESAARSSPHLEVFRRKEVEVLVLADRVDEWMLSFLQEFDGKALVSVARGGLDLGALQDAEEKQKVKETAKEFADLVGRIKGALGERVKDVRVTDRLTDSPSCLVSDDGDISGTLERLLKQAGQKAPDRKPILEINPSHPLVARMKSDTANDEGWSRLLFDQAMLAEGAQLEDPAGFVKRLNDMLLALSLR
jgi:molecular chaperone HtpG